MEIRTLDSTVFGMIVATMYFLISGIVTSIVILKANSFKLNCQSAVSIRCRTPLPSSSLLLADLSSFTNEKQTLSKADALLLLDEAKALRAQAFALQQQLDKEKEEKIRREKEKVDALIDELLFHGTTACNHEKTVSTIPFTQPILRTKKSQQQLVNTEAKVAELLIEKRLNFDQVNQIFDRICELSNRPQSIDSCSPLLSLLLDAACKVDCLEKDENPNKRWNHRVERDLRRKLFALGYGIRIEDVEKKERVRAITGEKDYY